MLSPPPPRLRTQMPELDTLRGLAIALVLATHVEGWIGMALRPRARKPWGRALLAGGDTGVALFFVLSAFLLTRPFFHEARGGPRVSLVEFGRRRFFRIVPLYACVVLLTAACTPPYAMTRALPYLVFVPPGLIPPAAQLAGVFSGPWWSLATEVQFYLLLPLVVLVARAGGLAAAALLGVILLVAHIAIRSATFGLTIPHLMVVRHTVLGLAHAFAAGAFVAWLVERFGPAWHARAARMRWLAAGGADLLLLGVILSYLGSLAAIHRTVPAERLAQLYPAWAFVEATAWALTVLGAVVLPLSRAWVARPVMALGVLSYSIYLLHAPVIGLGSLLLRVRGVGFSARSIGAAVVMVGVTIALAWGTYRWIEAPMIARGKRHRPQKGAHAHEPAAAV